MMEEIAKDLMSEKVEITVQLLDMLVNAVANLPYAQAQPLFAQLSQELSSTQQQSSIIH